MPPKCGTVSTRQPERLPGDRTHGRVEVGQPQPGHAPNKLSVADQTARRRRPQQAGIVALTLECGERRAGWPATTAAASTCRASSAPIVRGQEADLDFLYPDHTTRGTGHK